MTFKVLSTLNHSMILYSLQGTIEVFRDMFANLTYKEAAQCLFEKQNYLVEAENLINPSPCFLYLCFHSFISCFVGFILLILENILPALHKVLYGTLYKVL